MPTIAEVLEAAVKFHQSGNLGEAQRLYQEIIKVHPRHADAWHLSGLIALQQNAWPTALEHISRAIEIDGNQPGFHNHLAQVYRALGRPSDAQASCQRAIAINGRDAQPYNTLGTLYEDQGQMDQAIGCYRRAVELQPQHATALCNLGAALRRQGQLSEATECFRRAIQCGPDYAIAHDHLGLALRQAGNINEAIEEFRAATRLDPRLVSAQLNLGAALQAESRLDEARACFEQALKFDPNNAKVHCSLGSILQTQGQIQAAVECYLQALRIDPNLADAHFGLGVVLQHQRDLKTAADCYSSAIRCKPDHAEAYTNLGMIFRLQKKISEAMACYDTALRFRPEMGEAHRNRAMLRLLLGNYEQGWPEYEWRRRLADYQQPHFPQPDWPGQAVPGRTILLVAEQGLGDAIQFARYAPLVKQRSEARVILRCHPNWHAILKTAPGIDEVVGLDVSGVPFEYCAPLVSLPFILKTTVETIPAPIPYLSADNQRVEHWRRELGPSGPFKVGIAWQGSPGFSADFYRSIPLESFLPLAACDNVKLFSLQKNFGREQLSALAGRLPIVDLGETIDEGPDAFLDTAAVMMNLDLIITCDTAIGHLAGALGVPFWEVLQYTPNWRWLLDRADSPWYPTARLFRQPSFGDWSGVFKEMAAELQSLSSASLTS